MQRERYTHFHHRLAPLQLLFLCLLFLSLASCGSSSTPSGLAVSIQQAPASRLTYVALGASDTFGIGTDDPQTQSWPVDLAQQLGSSVRLVNLGIPNIHLSNALHVELPIALAAHPQLVTVWLAVNDLADQVPVSSYANDLDQLLSSLHASNPQMRIAVANVPDLTLLPHFQNVNQQVLSKQIVAYNTAIATIVQRHHALLVDLYQRWHELATHPEYISNDGFHPSVIGYARIAEIFYQVLQENPQP